MKKHEFQRALRRHDLNYESFGFLIGKSRETVCRYGVNGDAVPPFVALIMRLIQERGGAKDLFPERVSRETRP